MVKSQLSDQMENHHALMERDQHVLMDQVPQNQKKVDNLVVREENQVVNQEERVKEDKNHHVKINLHQPVLMVKSQLSDQMENHRALMERDQHVLMDQVLQNQKKEVRHKEENLEKVQDLDKKSQLGVLINLNQHVLMHKNLCVLVVLNQPKENQENHQDALTAINQLAVTEKNQHVLMDHLQVQDQVHHKVVDQKVDLKVEALEHQDLAALE
jgi:hypothetical protein